MKRLAATVLFGALFSTALVAGKGPAPVTAWPDSLRSFNLYTEGIKQNVIAEDTLEARKLFREAIRLDSTYAPAYYELAANGMYATPDEAVSLARRAHELDTANVWYHQLYGQMLIMAQRYSEALRVYRTLMARNPKDPDNYRLVAALYEQQELPYSAIATLDSAELRFGTIPLLSTMKRRVLVATRQFDKALQEAETMAEAAPYDAQHLVVLADLYAAKGNDSVAMATYDRALRIDSTNVETLMALSDYYNSKHDYRSLLSVAKRLFLSDDVPLKTKISRFNQYTSDTRFYRDNYIQLNDLATTLTIRYPQESQIVELYANHLIVSGELQQALALYKIHTHDTPPVSNYFKSVIDIESYLQHPDSVEIYIDRALKLFPDKPEFHISKGHALIYSKQYDKAIKAYKKSLRHAPNDSLKGLIWGYIGDSWHQRAEASQARFSLRFPGFSREGIQRSIMQKCYRAYDKSLHLFPDNAMVLNNYAYFLSLDGRKRALERALQMSSRAIALSENNPTYLDTYAWILFRLGRAAEARKIMQQAIALDRQENPELMVHYGDILAALGETFMAETYWRKALEKGYDPQAIATRIENSNKQ